MQLSIRRGEGVGWNLLSNIIINTNTWYHATAVISKQDSSAKLYINGQFDNEMTFDNTVNYVGSDPMSIGRIYYLGQTWSGFYGAIDDIHIYNRALSECEIKELFTGQPSCIQIYTCIGFEPPLADGPVTSKKNRVLPLKAQIFNTNGDLITDTDIVAPPVIQVLFNSGSGGDPLDVTDDALPAGLGTEGNQFVFTDEGKWQFNLKTKEYTASGTYSISVVSGDDSEYIIGPSCVAQFVIE